MVLKELQRDVLNLREALLTLRKNNLDLIVRPRTSDVFDYDKAKNETLQRTVPRYIKTIQEKAKRSASYLKGKPLSQLLQLSTELEIGMTNNDVKGLSNKVEEIVDLLAEVGDDEGTQTTVATSEYLPKEIKEEIIADVNEMQKCFENGCYRSVVILCGRILEIALNRKAFEVTNVDYLEKSPGMGLGKIIAKLREHDVQLDPGLTQQVHLINQIRVFSVHQKQEPFNPSENQAKAMMLYTMDVLEKLYK